MKRHYPLDPATGLENPALVWADGVPASGVEGSYPGHLLVTNPQDELLNLIGEALLTPTDTDLSQITRAIRGGQLTTFTDTSTVANTIVIAPTTAHTAPTKGLPFRLFPNNTNTGAVNLIVNTLAATPLKNRDGSPLQAGDLSAGVPVDVVDDGTNYRVLGFLQSTIFNLGTSRGPFNTYGTTPVTLTVADTFKLTNLNQSASVVNLPLSTTVPSGRVLLLINTTNGNGITINANAADTIFVGRGYLTSISLGYTESIELTCQPGANNWTVTGGTALSRYSNSNTSSLAQSGFKRFQDANSPTGYVILQWGVNLVTTANALQLVALPVTFPNGLLGTPLGGSNTLNASGGAVGNNTSSFYVFGSAANMYVSWRVFGY